MEQAPHLISAFWFLLSTLIREENSPMPTRLAILLLLSSSALAQPAVRDLHALDWMIGTWRGTSSGQAGEGMVERVCAPLLAGRYLECRTTVMYPSQEKNKKGEVHTDLMLFSFDKRTKTIRMRQFNVEGFVNTFSESTPLVFTTVAIENLPEGWRARETYTNPAPGEWKETFELAEPGKEFGPYSANALKRAP
jgi:hypothetical protein